MTIMQLAQISLFTVICSSNLSILWTRDLAFVRKTLGSAFHSQASRSALQLCFRFFRLLRCLTRQQSMGKIDVWSTMWIFMVLACWISQSANMEELIRKRHMNRLELMNISEIIDYWGYPNEEYQVLTADGYFLQVNRIPYGVHSPGKTGHRPAILLVHGFLAEGRTWIANPTNKSLGFFLADAGYDVWILNCRGSTWSRRHLFLSIQQEKFWDFSFHEMGIYDVPATINFILQKIKQDALYYVGHSQGSTIGFIAFSLMPQLAEKVKLFFCLAPGYSLVGSKGILIPPLSLPTNLQIALFGNKELILFSKRLKEFLANLCSRPGLDQVCTQIIFAATGFNEHNLNVSRAYFYFGIFPDFSSAKTGQHWSQVFKSKQFKYFDYGPKNKEYYNKTTPLFYKIEDMIVPTAVFYGGNDFITTKEDTELLLPRLSHLVYQKYIPTWQHADYIFGLDAPEQLYSDVLFLMEQYK